jgi:phosphoglycerate dehydrogenase-like enzyme
LSAQGPRVLVIGRQAGLPPGGLPEQRTGAEYVMADDMETIRAHLAGCDVVFHYNHPRDALSANWELCRRLRWVHIGGVGVDWALFPELVASEVVLTNSRGIFDITLPEYLLTLMLALVKDLPATLRAQAVHEWQHGLLQPLHGARAVIVGAGSIGRAAARLLRSLGLEVTLVGRRARPAEPGAADDGRIRGIHDLPKLLPGADWLILLAPLTPETRGLIGAAELALLPPGARVANLGRGPLLVEAALIEALRSGRLAGAALDVFEREPLDATSPLWDMPNVIVSPHIGGDVVGVPEAFGRVFLANLERYIAGEPLQNVVDKHAGYVRDDPRGQVTADG